VREQWGLAAARESNGDDVADKFDLEFLVADPPVVLLLAAILSAGSSDLTCFLFGGGPQGHELGGRLVSTGLEAFDRTVTFVAIFGCVVGLVDLSEAVGDDAIEELLVGHHALYPGWFQV